MIYVVIKSVKCEWAKNLISGFKLMHFLEFEYSNHLKEASNLPPEFNFNLICVCINLVFSQESLRGYSKPNQHNSW